MLVEHIYSTLFHAFIAPSRTGLSLFRDVHIPNILEGCESFVFL